MKYIHMYKRPNLQTTGGHHGVLVQPKYHISDPCTRAYYVYAGGKYAAHVQSNFLYIGMVI